MTAALTQTHPTPFWDKIAPKYAKKPVADPAAYDAKLTRMRALLRAEDRMLEIGCGTGSTALHLAPKVAEVTATDISREMIAIAEQKRVEAKANNVIFRQAGADFHHDAAPFDVVTAFSLLHLAEDVPAVLRAVYAQTRPGGLFVSKTVCLSDANVALRLFVRGLHLVGLAPHVTMLSKASLRTALIDAGFDILESQHFGKGQLNPFIIAQRPN